MAKASTRSGAVRASTAPPTISGSAPPLMSFRLDATSGKLAPADAPFVATRVGGIPEVIEDRVSGRIVPPDAPPALAAVLDELLGDPAARARLAAAGRDRVRAQFGLETMLQRFDAYLCGVAGKHPPVSGGEPGS